MRHRATLLSIAITLICASTVRTQVTQAPPPSGAAAFNGRWALTAIPAGQSAPAANAPPFLIVEIKGADASVAVAVVDAIGFSTPTVTESSLSGGQLAFVVQMNGQSMKLQARRNGDHLDGTIAIGTAAPSPWIGRFTTDDMIDLSTALRTSPETQAFNDALTKPPAERADALRQFLAKYPNTNHKDMATLQIALALPAAERPDALKRFLTDFPAASPVLKEQAEFELMSLIRDPAERRAAEQKFTTDHPLSSYTNSIFRGRFESSLREKPVDDAKVLAAIDAFINSASERPIPLGRYTANLRADAMNTVGDRLMNAEVLLDKALDVMQKALTLAGDQAEPSSLSIYLTTLGEVQFKLKKYDEAGVSLKRAVAVSGNDADGETQLFLGKFYDVKHQDDLAIAALLKAWQMGAPLDTKPTLERVYLTKYGSLDGLKAEFERIDAKLDADYLARPKLFDAGHYTRPPASTDSGKIVLAELFTGSECAPCVGADMAFDGLSERYDRGTVAILEYHLHIPGPDPMTNSDTEARATYYGVHATPTVVFDGASLPASGGSASMARGMFTEYTGKIEPRLAGSPAATLSSFAMTARGDTITVTGQAALPARSGGARTNVVLRVALVEDVVRYAGSNGVRFHHLVVRKLIGSPAGTPLPAGKSVAYSQSVSVASVSSALDAYLSNYEKERSTRSAFVFKNRVDHLDPMKLMAVVFAQDEKTKEILQSLVIAPVK